MELFLLYRKNVRDKLFYILCTETDEGEHQKYPFTAEQKYKFLFAKTTLTSNTF